MVYSNGYRYIFDIYTGNIEDMKFQNQQAHDLVNDL